MLFIVFFFIVILVVFIGNFVVIVFFIKIMSFKISINYYIVNMVVLDFFCVCFNWLLFVVEGMLIS